MEVVMKIGWLFSSIIWASVIAIDALWWRRKYRAAGRSIRRLEFRIEELERKQIAAANRRLMQDIGLGKE